MRMVHYERNEPMDTFNATCNFDVVAWKAKNKAKHTRAILRTIEKSARSYVKHLEVLAEEQMIPLVRRRIEVTEQGTAATMHLYGVKKEFCTLAARMVIDLLRSKGWK
jgi:hypothetical protein